MGLIEPRIHGTTRCVFAVEVLDVADAPDAADEELRVRLDRGGLDDHALDAEVGELGLVDVGLLVEGDGDLVDDPVPPALAGSST